MYPIWEGALIDLVFLLFIAIVAIYYHFIWWDLFQMMEPFTHIFARIAQKRPWFFYGIVGLLIVVAMYAGIVIHYWYWQVIHIFLVGFFGWLIGHIIAAASDPNNPPHLPHRFSWQYGRQKACE